MVREIICANNLIIVTQMLKCHVLVHVWEPTVKDCYTKSFPINALVNKMLSAQTDDLVGKDSFVSKDFQLFFKVGIICFIGCENVVGTDFFNIFDETQIADDFDVFISCHDTHCVEPA